MTLCKLALVFMVLWGLFWSSWHCGDCFGLHGTVGIVLVFMSLWEHDLGLHGTAGIGAGHGGTGGIGSIVYIGILHCVTGTIWGIP